MSQHILNVRARPYRVAVLLAKDAPAGDLMLGLEFMSRIWGGRYGQLLAVERGGGDAVTAYRLARSRPDLVYGVGVDHDAWKGIARDACQPRAYRPLDEQYLERLLDEKEELVTVDHVIHHLRGSPVPAGQRGRPWRLVHCDPASPLRPFVAALFGVPYEGLGDAIPHEEVRLPGTSGVADLIAAHADFLSNGYRPWLSLASHGLTYSMTPANTPAPTIIAVNSAPADLALYWCLRHGARWLVPPWVVPVPAGSLADAAVMAVLADLIRVWEKFCRCESCRVISTSLPREEVAAIAGRLQEGVRGTMIARFHAAETPVRLPIMVPFESEQHLATERRRRALTFRPPRPKILEGVSNGAWVVEVVKDVGSGRAAGEMCLPPRASAFEVLNAPGPTSVQRTMLPQLGDGVDGINALCSDRREFLRIQLPSPAEVLEEILLDAGIMPAEDEKRACYLPAVRLFGGLAAAAQAFSGQRGAVLRTLLGGPLTLAEIQGKAKLGKGRLGELAEPEYPPELLSDMSPVARRTFRRRRSRLWARTSPGTTALEALLEFWADRGVLSRRWRLGPCRACKGTFWEAAVDISAAVPCPGCGRRLRLPPQLPLGYSVHRLVSQAASQGIGPVVLAGRFLRGMTERGFFWLPGVKYRWGGEDGDLDLIACCDGHVVVAECKTLDGTPADTGFWEVILGQFAGTIKASKACRAGFAVLAVMAECFPADFQRKVDELAGPSMRCLLLNRQDLERGHRLVKDDVCGWDRRLCVQDFVFDPLPDLGK